MLNELPFPTPGYLPDPEIESEPLVSPALAGRFATTATPGKILTAIPLFPLLLFTAGSIFLGLPAQTLPVGFPIADLEIVARVIFLK